MAATKQRIGFVGVGRMGSNMARHLKDDGYEVSILFDLIRDVAKNLATELGCRSTDRLAEVTADGQPHVVGTAIGQAMGDIVLHWSSTLELLDFLNPLCLA